MRARMSFWLGLRTKFYVSNRYKKVQGQRIYSIRLIS